MRTTIVWAAVLISGCSLLVDPRASYEYDLRDGGQSPRDGGQRDGGGERDGGNDACVPTAYYADADGDDHGDPAVAVTACAPLAGHVTAGDDCDDGDGTVRPGATEICDDVDQDCDGAIDEGLIGPIGSWIEVVPDLGGGFPSMGAVAHREGVVVMWRTDGEDILRASFFDRAGVPLAANVLIAGNYTRLQSVMRFDNDGLEQVVFAWVYPTDIRVGLCSTSGVCSEPRTVFSGDTTTVNGLRVAQLGRRLIAYWKANDSPPSIVSIDPRTGDTSDPLVLPPPDGATSTTYTGLATIDGDDPYSLVGRFSGTVEGTTVVGTRASLLRINGETALSFSETDNALNWDFTGACASVGGTDCFGTLAPYGRGRPGALSLILFQQVTARDAGGSSIVSRCIFGATPQAHEWPLLSECVEATDLRAFALRDSVLTTLVDAGTDYAIREVPLGPGPSGSDLVALPGLSPGDTSPPSLSMYRNRGIAFGSTRAAGLADLSFLRLGCEP